MGDLVLRYDTKLEKHLKKSYIVLITSEEGFIIFWLHVCALFTPQHVPTLVLQTVQKNLLTWLL